MSQIIKPEGIELMEYLNEGYAICNKCGAVMDRREHPRGGNDIYTCPSCGWNIDVMDVEHVEVLIRAVNYHARYLTNSIRETKS